MEDIKIMEKPDWVSWDEIHELLLAAHKKNIEKGLVMNTTTMSGDEIRDYLGENGRCFVAFCGGALVGTTSVRVVIGKNWYNRGKVVAKEGLTGILKQYQGIGILGEMNAVRDKYIEKCGVQLLEGDTPENNTIVRKLVANNGYKEVRYFSAIQKHYSVGFVKWLNGSPFSDKYIKRRFKISKILTKIQYKPGKEERSRFLTLLCKVLNRIVSILFYIPNR